MLTIEDGGYVDVDGTLTIGPLATLNLNGGTLIVPEAAGIMPPLAAALALALLRRRRD